jgi:hypothetical protein
VNAPLTCSLVTLCRYILKDCDTNCELPCNSVNKDNYMLQDWGSISDTDRYISLRLFFTQNTIKLFLEEK